MSIVIQVLSIRGLHFSESNQKVTSFEDFNLPQSCYSTFPNLGFSITMATPINIAMVIRLVVTKFAIQAINYRGHTKPCDVGVEHESRFLGIPGIAVEVIEEGTVGDSSETVVHLADLLTRIMELLSPFVPMNHLQYNASHDCYMLPVYLHT